jgi:hypothetical protein
VTALGEAAAVLLAWDLARDDRAVSAPVLEDDLESLEPWSLLRSWRVEVVMRSRSREVRLVVDRPLPLEVTATAVPAVRPSAGS